MGTGQHNRTEGDGAYGSREAAEGWRRGGVGMPLTVLGESEVPLLRADPACDVLGPAVQGIAILSTLERVNAARSEPPSP